MRDDYRPRSPNRGSRERDYNDRRDGYNQSRQGHSRTPDHRDDYPRERGSRYQDDNMSGSYGDGYDRGNGRRSRNEHDYTGMYDDVQGGRETRHDGPERSRHDRRGYRESDDHGRYNRSRSTSPLRDAGRPSDTVILEGLPFSVSASELQESILRNSVAADFPSIDVRVSSTKGQRRAFIQFESIDYAVTFIREHFPKLQLELPQSTDEVPDGRFEAFVHYARSRDDDNRGASSSNWACPSCDFSNYSTRTQCKICGTPISAAPDWQQSLTGQADAAAGPTQILVVYPLAGFVNEEMLAGDMKRLELEKPNPSKDPSSGAPKLKSTAPTGNASGLGARPGSLHRVFLMRDVYNHESYKYGFAEFWTIEDAAAAMAKVQASRTFAVAACAVTVSMTHMGVFLPEDRELTPAIEQTSFFPLFNPSLRVRYRDLRLYPSQRIVTTEPPGEVDPSKSADDAAEAKKNKKRKAEGAPGPPTNKKPVAMAGQMAMWQRKHDELHGQKESAEGPAEPPPRSDANDGFKQDPNAPIKISLSGAKIGAASDASPKRPASPEKPIQVQASTASIKAQAPPEDNVVSYVDRDRLMCLICMRKYKSIDEVNIHEKSRNHMTAMDDPELVKAAVSRLAARGKRIQKQTVPGEEAGTSTEPQYRDRAKERRQVYGQPKKASGQTGGSSKPNPSTSTTVKPEDTPPATAKPSQSKGAGMLAKMGWTSGAGLGANGEGRTDVIEQTAYQEGVGLGAEGSNLGDAAQLAERKTKNSYAEYVNTVQDKARERYNKME